MPNDSLTNSPTDNSLCGADDWPDASTWQGLSPATGPFVHHDFLSALEISGCTGGDTGWRPFPQTIEHGGQVRAAAPSWLKYHSHGEFVFDWAWARAAHQGGLRWYPKLLVAAPFSPITGPRLLGVECDRLAAEQLVQQFEQQVQRRALSSAGVNFCTEADAEVLSAAGWLPRFDWQFHWKNEGYRDFDDFLERFRRKARKNIRAERRKVVGDGWTFQWKSGTELGPVELDLIDRCYRSTFQLYGNHPSLNRAFFEAAAARFGDAFLVCLASREAGQPEAAAIFWRDQERLYGRYWGSLGDTRDVHFEACYYQGIDYCIQHGLQFFEPGAQGEHKIRRGFLPQRTRSFHYIRHPGLRAGIARYLQAEAEALADYRKQLERLNPFA